MALAFSGPFQKLCILRVHEHHYSPEDVLLNLSQFPSSMRIGDLAQIVPLKSGTNTRDFVNGPDAERDESSSHVLVDEDGTELGRSNLVIDHWRAYPFVVRDASVDIRDKDPNLKISVASAVASIFGLKSGMKVIVQLAERDQCVASHVELTFRDEYLSRGDMWRLATSELAGRTVYKDQKILFLNTIKATVKNVYVNHRSKLSGYFAPDTKPIFRSESARYTLFIQMSREMWEFDTESAGEIMFNKVIHGFLPELFKKWMSINAHHLVSIILFARLESEDNDQQSSLADEIHDRASGKAGQYQDYYRVVVSDMASNDWINILDQLKREFLSFLEDISVQQRQAEKDEKYVIAGSLSQAHKGNILEALMLASSQFSRDYIDRDLVRTGISVIVITAGAGYYEVSYDMLKLTTDVLMESGIGIDLVCLAPMPLHSVPLFAYRTPRALESTVPTRVPSPGQSFIDSTPRLHENYLRKVMSNNMIGSDKEPKAGDWSYAIPHWIDVSYWRGETIEGAMQLKRSNITAQLKLRKTDQTSYQPRVRLYDLQMGGLMENEMTNITIAPLHEHALHPWHRLRHHISGKPVTKETEDRIGKEECEWMDVHDDFVFLPESRKKAKEEEARFYIQKTASDDGKLSIETRKQDVPMREDLATGQVGSYRPGREFLDWHMKDEFSTSPHTPKQVPARRKQSFASLASNATTDTSANRTPSRKLLRQISFGTASSTKTAAKTAEATVSTDHSTAGTIKPVMFAKLNQHTSSNKQAPVSTFTQQFRAALNRSSSQNSSSISANIKTIEEESKDSTQPIEIDSIAKMDATRLRVQHGRQSSDEIIASSLDTIRGSNRGGIRRDLLKDQIAEATLGGMAHLRKNIPYLSSSAEAVQMPTTLSLSQALAPWMVLLNPCKPKKEDLNTQSQFTRWQHVFPKARRADTVKWRSLCYPASVPLTKEFFPTADQLAAEYHENFYHLIQDTDHDPAESREHLVRELIAFRLTHGFQLIVGESVSEFLGNRRGDLALVFDKSYMAQDGATIFMSLGSIIHQLLCGPEGKVEIRRFHRKPTQEYEPFDGSNAVSYQPLIKTYLEHVYSPRTITFKKSPRNLNWNMVDNFIAGYSEDFSDALRFWRARFVLIPVEIPSKSNALSTVREDTDEEIRLEGIRRLTQLWQRNRILSEEEALAQSLNKKKDHNPLKIEYQTRDPSAVIAAGLDTSLYVETEPGPPATVETHTTKSYELKTLADELQSENGVQMLDRRWHWRLHYNCFLGSDMTNWILLRFKDIDTREAAVEFGNTLMQAGLFVHVKGEKDFRDGQYFYQLANEYRNSRPESRMGWFGSARSGLKSIPATPMTESRMLQQTDGSSDSDDRSATSEAVDDEKSVVSKPERRKVYLSNVMKYNVDSRHKSYRPEIINLHYDRLHNPDNCYHLRIDWMNVTSKFIEDSIVVWATTVERYGLRLVEVPIAEACAITNEHPFRSPYLIKLARQPPSVPITRNIDATSFNAMKKVEAYRYHKALLKKMNFVLDVEAASSFPTENVDVCYSWGAPDYRYTQYIHKHGTLLAQITSDGNFLLLANRLYSDRGSARLNPNRLNIERELDRRIFGGVAGRKSPMASPAMRPIIEGTKAGDALPLEKSKVMTAEEIKDDMESICYNEAWLKAFYQEVDKLDATAASPSVQPAIPELNMPARTKLAL